MSKNPYDLLEALGEHVGSAWSALREEGREVGIAGKRPVFKIGTVEYHLAAIEIYQAAAFQAFAKAEDQTLFHLLHSEP
jgi:hypothetical protein